MIRFSPNSPIALHICLRTHCKKGAQRAPFLRAVRIGFADVRQKTLRLEGPLAGSGASFFVLQEEEDIFRLGDSAENGDDHFKDKAANQVHMLCLDT